MSLAHEVKHRLELTLKKAEIQFSLAWNPQDKDMMTIWKDGEYVEPTKWFVKKNFLVFKSKIEKGSKLSIREFEVVGKRKRK